MPKVKIARKSVSLDMTAMCDMAFLLLNFFILTAKFTPAEAVVVDTPSSVSDITLPDKDMININIDKDGRVFIGIDGQFVREGVIKDMAGKYGIQLTEKMIKEFSLMNNFGVPVSMLPGYLALKPADRNKANASVTSVPGIPVDSSSNELREWITYARYRNTGFRLAIKGDQASNYAVAKKVISTLQDMNINKFNLITNLEERPKIPGLQ